MIDEEQIFENGLSFFLTWMGTHQSVLFVRQKLIVRNKITEIKARISFYRIWI